MSQEQPTQDRPRIRLSSHVPDGEVSVGLVCRKCGCRHFHVYKTRPIIGGIRRYRECRHCGRRIVTTERL